jgi:hypothetical protein
MSGWTRSNSVWTLRALILRYWRWMSSSGYCLRKGRFDETDVLSMLRHMISIALASGHHCWLHTLEEFQRWANI